jgi:hypothetical protein
VIDDGSAAADRGVGEWLLYAPAAQVNEATRYYIETLAMAGRQLGRELRHVESLAEVPDGVDVLTVECKSAYKLRLARPRSRFWIWIQGVTPEEARLQFNSPLREALWNHFERRTLRRAAGLFMVSKAMRAHYAAKHGTGGCPTFVMPCVNAEIDPRAFAVPGKYERPTFVYAGNLHAWQCFDLTLETFAIIKGHCPSATLTVLTGQQDEARRAVAAAGLTDVEVGFVQLDQLPAALARYKYGFVLRRPHIVNKVATPTKVSTYMASGVIPIMTTAMGDYNIALAEADPLVLSSVVDPGAIAEQVLDVETSTLVPAQILANYRLLFSSYFSRDFYADALSEFLRTTGLAVVYP